MTLYKDQVVDGFDVADEVVRGAAWRREFEFYRNANAGENAQVLPPALGDNLNLSASLGVIAVGKVFGTNTRLTVTATFISQGSTTTPARVAVECSGESIADLCYRTGAGRAFRWSLYYFDATGTPLPLLGGVTSCIESGAGGTS